VAHEHVVGDQSVDCKKGYRSWLAVGNGVASERGSESSVPIAMGAKAVPSSIVSKLTDLILKYLFLFFFFFFFFVSIIWVSDC
jgi:hypothetical protein